MVAMCTSLSCPIISTDWMVLGTTPSVTALTCWAPRDDWKSAKPPMAHRARKVRTMSRVMRRRTVMGRDWRLNQCNNLIQLSALPMAPS